MKVNFLKFCGAAAYLAEIYNCMSKVHCARMFK